MKFQRSTIILLFGALLMGGAFYYYQNLFIPAQEAREAFAKKLFKFKKEDVQALFVKTKNQTLRFERASDLSTPQDLWWMQILEVAAAANKPAAATVNPKPTATAENNSQASTTETATSAANAVKETVKENSKITPPTPPQSTQTSQEKVYANEAYVSFLLEQLVTQRSEQTLTATPEQLKEYGLNPPLAVIEVILKDKRIYQMTLGKSEFSGTYIYAQVNPPLPETENQTVLVVSKNFEYAVDRTLEDWKQPPEILGGDATKSPGKPSSNETKNAPPANNSQPDSQPEKLEKTPENAEPNSETTPKKADE